MGTKIKLSLIVPGVARYISLFSLLIVGVFSLALLSPTNVSAKGEQYSWEDRDTISGTGGEYGGISNLFSKGQHPAYPSSQLTELYAYDDVVTTPDGCVVVVGIQVNASDKSKGTLRRIVDPVLSGSNGCPDNYSLSEHFTTQIQLANSGKANSDPSTVISVIVRSLVSDAEDFPGEGDTFTVKYLGDNRVLATKKATEKHAYSADGQKGYERTFKFKTSPGQKNYEACSAVLNQCSAANSGIITGPQNIYVIEIVRDNTNTDVVCSAGALGWVFCPLSEALVGTIEGAASLLEDLLIYQPLLNSDQGKAVRAIWQSLLVIANVGLVIAVLIIVFSQATSVGLSSYGIKKLLPRLIAAAIMMNLSFYLCAAAVDISNILGVSIKSIVDAGMTQLSDINSSNGNVQSGASAEQVFAASAVGILTLAIAIGTGAIWLVLPLLAGAALAILTALLIIGARQVLITLLIIVAPLAILAWILPNTDEWFTKWRKIFVALLLLFPLIMAIFYGAVLVSSVIISASGGNSGTTLNNFTIQLLAFIVLFVPLFSLPFIMKAAGGILDRFGVLVNNRNKGLIDRSRKKSQEMYGARKDTRRMNAFGEGRTMNPWKANARRQANRDYRRNLRKGIAEENSQDFIAKRALDGSDGRFGYAGRMAASGNPQYIAAVQASAQATVDKQDRQSVANREILYKARLKPGDNKAITSELQTAAKQNDTVAVRALQNMYIANGSAGIDEMRAGMSSIEQDSSVSAETLSVARKNLNENHGQRMKEKAYDMLLWSSQAKGGGALGSYSEKASTWSGLSVAEIAAQSGGSVEKAAVTGAITQEKLGALLDDARVKERLSDAQAAALLQARAFQGVPTKPSQPAVPGYNDNIQATQRREQDEAYETYRDNINPPPPNP